MKFEQIIIRGNPSLHLEDPALEADKAACEKAMLSRVSRYVRGQLSKGWTATRHGALIPAVRNDAGTFHILSDDEYNAALDRARTDGQVEGRQMARRSFRDAAHRIIDDLIDKN